ERFRVSPDLAQRARRVLEGRAATWKGRPTDPVLDRVDLAAVEEGLPWMRAPVKDEHVDEPGLIAASSETLQREQAREAERQRQLDEAIKNEERARADHQKETELRLRQQQEANRRLRQRAYVAVGTAILAVLIAVIAGLLGNEAWKQTNIAKIQTK